MLAPHNNCHETNPLRMDRDLQHVRIAAGAHSTGWSIPEGLLVKRRSFHPPCHPYLRSIVHHSATCAAAIKTIGHPVRLNMRVFLAFLVAAVLLVKNDVAAATSSLSENMSPDSVQMPNSAPRLLRYYTTAEEKEATTEERTFDAAIVDDLISAQKIDEAVKSMAGLESFFGGLRSAQVAERVGALERLRNDNNKKFLILLWNGYVRDMDRKAKKAAKAARNAE
ncbi:unnamed protein product [Phytophthora fragariaefolia]|uniref:RxLR effector protein n=1 Tax=Phytophthora fragariaefolia TaxID=1490495 RepID=A0A9W6XQ93_9STRA|nr:unnamed protein product [Phytophthora fragariaefolia]